jgi:hypothetical protein
MPFSMTSYFLGVGTVVGALALGFGGGIVLTNTAIKDTPTGPSRVERAARAEPVPSPQMTEAKAVAVPRAEGSQVPAAVEPKFGEPKPVAEAPRQEPPATAEPVRQIDTSKAAEQPIKQTELPKAAEPARQAEAPKEAELPRHIEAKQSEPKQAEQKQAEQKQAEREKRRAEARRIEREKRIAERERKARTMVIVRRQPLEDQEPRAQPELAFQRDEPRGGGLFEGLFGRPSADRD